MKRILSAISLVFCLISAKSQINIFHNFENSTYTYEYFTGGPFSLNNGNQYVCSGTSLTFNEFGYGNIDAYPTTVQFKTTGDDIIEKYKDINLSFKYKWKNINGYAMKVVVRYEISGCVSNPITGSFNNILISKDFTGSACLDYSATIPGNLINMSFCTLKIFFDLYSTSTTGTSTTFIVDDFKVSQTNTLNTSEVLNQSSEVFPNPFDEYIELKNIENVSKISITDISGKLLLEKENPTEKLYLHNFAKGIYILSITEKNGKKYSKKIIKK